jgi:hypothetical protein
MYCCTMENTYASTIRLQVLPNLFTPSSTREKNAPLYFWKPSIVAVSYRNQQDVIAMGNEWHLFISWNSYNLHYIAFLLPRRYIMYVTFSLTSYFCNVYTWRYSRRHKSKTLVDSVSVVCSHHPHHMHIHHTV